MKRFSCAELVELVTAYLDDALDAAERRCFDDHTAHCPSCSRHVAQHRAVIAALGDLPPEKPLSPAARDHLLAAFRRSHHP
ncbi:zf-HC2 domain-containing protein [Thermopolyspora sp. NPDC052614]|uniref:anti-sigma factor family protein n=1 Tax=Thermopolyspora sp. NPDC052614 TaxID=3155682 RepID=UPI003439EE93